jgi:hypothetical protein
MRKATLLGLVLVALVAARAGAEETADYEVHEWGFVAANAPADPKALENYLNSLPGNVRQMMLAAPGRDALPSGTSSDAVRGNPAGAPSAPPRSPAPGVPTPQDPTPQDPEGGRQPQSRVITEDALFQMRFDPFIWFHSKKPLSVRLKVNLGVNTPICWWPQGVEGATSLTWQRLRLTPRLPDDKRLEDFGGGASEFSTLAGGAREVNASFLGTGNKVEKFLMYDLMGIAWTDLRISKDAAGLIAWNRGPRPVRELFVFDETTPEGKALYAPQVRGYEKGRRLDTNADGYWNLVDFRIRMVKSLVEAGLHLDEAVCMVRGICSQEAFFKSKGVKAIHILDADEIAAVSRLELDPKPAVVKRVWVMLLWNAGCYNGLAPVFENEAIYERLRESIRKSGASKEEIARSLERLEIERERDSATRGRG